jgi:hypothetical protein
VGDGSPVIEDLWLPDPETAQTVRVGHSSLEFEEVECNLHVRVPQIQIETMMVRAQRPAVESAPTQLLPVAREIDDSEPSGLITAAPTPPARHSSLLFFLLLLAISLASVAAGLLIAPMVD